MRSRENKSRAIIAAIQVALGLTLVSLWQGLASAKLLDPFFFSRPSDIVARIWKWLATGTIWSHLIATVEESFLAFALGAAFGIVFGFVLARAPLLSRVLDPYIQMLNALPRVVLAPIFLLWFGLGIWSKVALGVTLPDHRGKRLASNLLAHALHEAIQRGRQTTSLQASDLGRNVYARLGYRPLGEVHLYEKRPA